MNLWPNQSRADDRKFTSLKQATAHRPAANRLATSHGAEIGLAKWLGKWVEQDWVAIRQKIGKKKGESLRTLPVIRVHLLSTV